MTQPASPPPAWLAQALDLTPFDARPLVAAGEDPLTVLMGRAEAVMPGGFLVIDAPFNPSPLRRLLAGQGFSSYGTRLSPSHWRVSFHRDGAADWQRDADIEMLPEGALAWPEEDGLHVDVRKLPPPQPMLAILRLLDGPPPLATLVVHHDRMPHYLLPELAERGWRIHHMTEAAFDIRLWLQREDR